MGCDCGTAFLTLNRSAPTVPEGIYDPTSGRSYRATVTFDGEEKKDKPATAAAAKQPAYAEPSRVEKRPTVVAPYPVKSDPQE